MNRSEMWRRIDTHPKPWDMIVVGGGATGVGVAIDAAARAGVTLGVIFLDRLKPEVQQMKALLDAQALKQVGAVR